MSHPSREFAHEYLEPFIEDLVLGHDINPNMRFPDTTFKATASEALRDSTGATPAGLIVERAFIARPKQNVPTYDIVIEEDGLPELEPNEVWIRHWEEGFHDEPPTDIHTLNERLRNRKRPAVKIESVPGDPNAVHVLRSDVYGRLVLKKVQELPCIMDAEVVETGRHNRDAEARYKTYPEGVLLRAIVDPSFYGMNAAKSQLEDLLVHDILPIQGGSV